MTSADEYAQKHIDHIMYEMFNMSLHVRSLSKFLINSDKFVQNIHYLFKEMPFITAVLFLHEVILKTFFPRYRLKAEALEATRLLLTSVKNHPQRLIITTANKCVHSLFDIFTSELHLKKKHLQRFSSFSTIS